MQKQVLLGIMDVARTLVSAASKDSSRRFSRAPGPAPRLPLESLIDRLTVHHLPARIPHVQQHPGGNQEDDRVNGQNQQREVRVVHLAGQRSSMARYTQKPLMATCAIRSGIFGRSRTMIPASRICGISAIGTGSAGLILRARDGWK